MDEERHQQDARRAVLHGAIHYLGTFLTIASVIIGALVLQFSDKTAADSFARKAYFIILIAVVLVTPFWFWLARPRNPVRFVKFEQAVLIIDRKLGYYLFGPTISRVNSNALVRVKTARALIQALVSHNSTPVPSKHELLKKAGKAVGNDFGHELLAEDQKPDTKNIQTILRSWMALDKNTGFANISCPNLNEWELGGHTPLTFYIGESFFHRRVDAGVDRFCSFFEGYIEAVLLRIVNPTMQIYQVAVERKCGEGVDKRDTVEDFEHSSCKYIATIK